MTIIDADSDVIWEQRRYEIAKSAMQGMVANSHERDYRMEEHYPNHGYRKIDPSEVAEYAVVLADALIAELKKKGE